MNLELRKQGSIRDGVKRESSYGETTIVEYVPGNGSLYLMSFTDLKEFSPEVKDRLGLGSEGDGVLVSYLNQVPIRTMVVICSPIAVNLDIKQRATIKSRYNRDPVI